MPRYKELRGKVAIVTGAGRGIGRAIALRLALEGVRVVVTDIDRTGAEAVADEIARNGGEATALKVDVTQRSDIESMIARTVDVFGELNILINNAGVTAVAPLIDMDEQTWDRVMAINAKGVWLCSQAAAKQMIKQGKGGRIITNASAAGKVVPGKTAPLGAYSASKHAVVSLTKQFGLELAEHQILVNCVCSGMIDTPMWDLIDRETAAIEGKPPGSVKARAAVRIPLQRMGKPEDIANVVAFLASDDASYMTADAINVAGGMLPY